MEIFASKGYKDINAINKLIWTNIQQLQQRKPVAGAPQRPIMPQTDPAKGFADKLKKGLVNFAKIPATPAVNKPNQQVTKEELYLEKLTQIIFEELNKK
jgi:hypothetical protein